MKYDAAMKTKDAAAWKVAVDEEHDRMVNNNAWKPIDRAKIPSNSKVLADFNVGNEEESKRRISS
jgi:hypothetical protein